MVHAGTYEVVADVAEDKMITMSRVFFDQQVKVIDPLCATSW
jgi:hypothetical protein